MSLINDALKRASQSPPRDPQNPFPPLPPIAARPASSNIWIIPAIVIIFIVIAGFMVGWVMMHRSVHNVAAVDAPPATAPAPVPTSVPPPATVAAVQSVAEVVPPPVVVNPPTPPLRPLPDAPKLQGIFYSPTAPAAIVNGKMVRPGDHFLNYRVAEITKDTVTLAAADGKVIKLGMDN
jgi:hypothetical protein